MKRVISYIESSFWACRAQEFDALCRIAYRESDRLESVLAAAESEMPKDFDAMLGKRGERLNGTRYVEVRENGVAVIDVNGVLAKRMNLFAEICGGGTSTETLLRDFNSALTSPNVSSIVFHIDSPGGEAFGINEFAQAVYDARGRKPMKAYVSGLGCSGAYWIASACDEVICDRSSFLGSVGVVTTWTDDRDFYRAKGIRREVVTSTNAPFKRLDFDNEEHRRELQRELDSMESVFHKAVARNRKVTVEQVRIDFNKGGVLAGADAVKAKMADRTGSLEQVIRELARKGKTNASSTGAILIIGDEKMSLAEKLKQFFASEEVKPLLEDGKEYAVVESPKAASGVNQAAANSSAPGPDRQDAVQAERERADKAEKESADARAELAKIKSEKLAAEAEDFIKTELAAGRMTPAETGGFRSLYIQAANDDQSSPLAEGSRLDNLRTIQSKRAPHGFTEERLDPKKGLQNLSGDESPDAKLERSAQEQADNYAALVAPGSKPKLEAVK